MKMSEQEIHLIHDLWDVMKSYSSNKDHEIVCEELLEKFDNNGFVIEDNVRELKGYDGTMDDVLTSMYYDEEEEQEEGLDGEDPETYDY
jgi:hypothetical protein|tara:strand:+ start:2802 stop:3068 length:267 start_codon:yes stop_codon:yes gene_type:complete